MKEIIDFKYSDNGKDELNNLRHSHGESYEILIIRAGSGSVIVRDRLFSMRSGAVYFINGMDTHCTVPENAEEYYRGKIVVSGSFINKIAEITDCRNIVDDLFQSGGKTCILPNEETTAYIDKEFSKIGSALSENSQYTKTRVSCCIMNILCACHSQNEELTLTIDNRVSKILEYINENLNRRFSLDDICEQIHVSRYYLCHIFKKTVGMTIFEYILSQRLSMAKKHLISTNMTLSQISDIAGFSSFSYFSKIFREHESCTPRQFRSCGGQFNTDK